MKYYEAALNTPSAEIDIRCSELEELGVNGFIIEDEEDFRNFLENNKQYWDYVDEDLNAKYAGVSRIRFYFTDDEEGERQLKTVLARYPECVVSTVQDSDWENNWREYYSCCAGMGNSAGRRKTAADSGSGADIRHGKPRHDENVSAGIGKVCRTGHAGAGSGMRKRDTGNRNTFAGMREMHRCGY